jgi:hypothetical protein
MLNRTGVFSDVTTHRDLNGKDRATSAVLTQPELTQPELAQTELTRSELTSSGQTLPAPAPMKNGVKSDERIGQ